MVGWKTNHIIYHMYINLDECTSIQMYFLLDNFPNNKPFTLNAKCIRLIFCIRT